MTNSLEDLILLFLAALISPKLSRNKLIRHFLYSHLQGCLSNSSQTNTTLELQHFVAMQLSLLVVTITHSLLRGLIFKDQTKRNGTGNTSCNNNIKLF